MTPSHSLGGEGSLLISVMLLEVMLLLSGGISAMLLEKSFQILFFQFIFLQKCLFCYILRKRRLNCTTVIQLSLCQDGTIFRFCSQAFFKKNIYKIYKRLYISYFQKKTYFGEIYFWMFLLLFGTRPAQTLQSEGVRFIVDLKWCILGAFILGVPGRNNNVSRDLEKLLCCHQWVGDRGVTDSWISILIDTVFSANNCGIITLT